MLQKPIILFYVSMLCLPFSAFAQNKIIYVNINSTGNNTGSSWQNAFLDLQDALASAQKNDAIWVAKGTYFPTKTSDRSISFYIKNTVSIYGGFAGNEISITNRDFEKNKTILSGNIGNSTDSLDNSYRIINGININDITYLDGVDIAYANANLSSNTPLTDNTGLSGAGLYVTTTSLIASKLEVKNCNFYNNFAKNDGAAIFFDCAEPDKIYINVKKCNFYNNSATRGGAVHISENSPLSVSIDSCTFKGNDGRYVCGGLFIESVIGKEYHAEIKNSNFISNSSAGGDAADIYFSNLNNKNYCTINIYNGFFGKSKKATGNSTFINGKSELLIQHSRFTNSAGIFASSVNIDIKVVNSIFLNGGNCISGNIKVLKNCIFYKNQVAASVDIPSNDVVRFDNNLFLSNTNLFNVYLSPNTIKLFLRNSIFINNTWLLTNEDFEKFEVQSSIIDDISQSNKSGKKIKIDAACLLNANPLFVDTSKLDFHLLPCSPAINTGNNAYAQGNLTDFDDKLRIAHQKIDIGPYEFQDFKIKDFSTKPSFCTSKEGAFLPILQGNCSNLPAVSWINTQNQTGNGNDKLASGTYTFFIKDTNGCADTLKNIEIKDNGNISADFNIFNTSGTNAKNGSITVTNVTNGKAPFKYIWSNGDTTKTIKNLAAGDYKVTISDANGCLFSTTLTIKAASALSDIFTGNISATPNPASDKITFHYDTAHFANDLFITFYDLQGKIVLPKQKLNANEQIDVSYFVSGLHFCQITDNQHLITKKIIILH